MSGPVFGGQVTAWIPPEPERPVVGVVVTNLGPEFKQ
jgi:hypothetical protein